MKITSVIIDDDSDSRLIISSFVMKECPEISITGEAASVKEALLLIEKQKPGLLFLDISLPDGTGFDLLKQLPDKNFEVIFITAFDKYAVEAFKVSATDYLLKPVAYDELREAIKRATERMQDRFFRDHWTTLVHNLQQKNSYERKLAIATGSGFNFVNISDIIRLESHSNYTHFYLVKGAKSVSSHTLGYYEELLPAERFCRIHNSHLVNIEFVDRYTRSGAGGTVILKDGTELSVSQRKKEQVFKALIKNG